MKHPVVLGLGSNTSFVQKNESLDPLSILKKSCRALSGFMEDIRFSSVYETVPMYVKDQQNFYNMAVAGFFRASPFDLLLAVHAIERAYGRDREREMRFGARTLDIDIELFAGMRIQSAALQIPHPRLEERAFVLVPMLEILPFFADIGNRAFYENCLKKTDSSEVKKVCSPFTF